MELKVPIQSVIDHIKTAIDVDDWAKEGAEIFIKKQIPVVPNIETDIRGIRFECGVCKETLWIQKDTASMAYNEEHHRYCPFCGQAVKTHA